MVVPTGASWAIRPWLDTASLLRIHSPVPEHRSRQTDPAQILAVTVSGTDGIMSPSVVAMIPTTSALTWGSAQLGGGRDSLGRRPAPQPPSGRSSAAPAMANNLRRPGAGAALYGSLIVHCAATRSLRAASQPRGGTAASTVSAAAASESAPDGGAVAQVLSQFASSRSGPVSGRSLAQPGGPTGRATSRGSPGGGRAGRWGSGRSRAAVARAAAARSRQGRVGPARQGNGCVHVRGRREDLRRGSGAGLLC